MTASQEAKVNVMLTGEVMMAWNLAAGWKPAQKTAQDK